MEIKTPISNVSQDKLKPCVLFRAIPVHISSSRIISYSPLTHRVIRTQAGSQGRAHVSFNRLKYEIKHENFGQIY